MKKAKNLLLLYRTWCCCFCIGLSLASPSLTAQTLPQKETLLVLGDGFSSAVGIPDHQVWVRRLERLMLKQGLFFNVVNVSEDSLSTQEGLAKLPKLLASHQPSWLFVILGMQDALLGKPIPQVNKNLALIIELAQRDGVQVALFGMQLPSNLDDRYNQAFSAMYAQLSRKYAVHYLPNFLEGIADNPALVQEDGIHPTLPAQPDILRNVWRVLGPLLVLSQPQI